MLPHHGQGANTTIEDAITLAELFARDRAGRLGPMLAKYQSLRRARTRKIQRSSWITNSLLHLPDGPQLAERDQRVTWFPEDFGWIHQFDALQTVHDATQTQRHPAPRTPEEVRMQQIEIETAFAELVNISRELNRLEIDRDLHLDKLGLTRSPKSTWPSPPKTVSALPYRMKI